jgi:endonuclease YncB( thermonuclease family)
VYEYTARLIRLVDADTLILDIDLGLHTWAHGVRIRAAGLNAPELSTPEGSAALRWVIDWFGQHCPDGPLTVRTQRDRNDNYGRLLGTITGPDGAVLNADMLAAGIAVPYPAVTAPTKEPQQ